MADGPWRGRVSPGTSLCIGPPGGDDSRHRPGVVRSIRRAVAPSKSAPSRSGRVPSKRWSGRRPRSPSMAGRTACSRSPRHRRRSFRRFRRRTNGITPFMTTVERWSSGMNAQHRSPRTSRPGEVRRLAMPHPRGRRRHLMGQATARPGSRPIKDHSAITDSHIVDCLRRRRFLAEASEERDTRADKRVEHSTCSHR